MDFGIKFRPIRSGSPHLNGKVERVQRTVKEEFYAAVDLGDPELSLKLQYWVNHYDYRRTYGAIVMTPIKKYCTKIMEAPYWEDVSNNYDDSSERIKERDYFKDLKVARLQGRNEIK